MPVSGKMICTSYKSYICSLNAYIIPRSTGLSVSCLTRPVLCSSYSPAQNIFLFSRHAFYHDENEHQGYTMKQKRKPTKKPESYEEFVSKLGDCCPLCGAGALPLFDDYLECTKCKHIFTRAGKAATAKCPGCGSPNYHLLFGKEVECRDCGHVYERDQSVL